MWGDFNNTSVEHPTQNEEMNNIINKKIVKLINSDKKVSSIDFTLIRIVT